jgi:hypothetical protein
MLAVVAAQENQAHMEQADLAVAAQDLALVILIMDQLQELVLQTLEAVPVELVKLELQLLLQEFQVVQVLLLFLILVLKLLQVVL